VVKAEGFRYNVLSMSNPWDNLFDDNEDSEGGGDGDDLDESEFPFWMNRDSIIFLIDAQKPMFEETLESEIPFHIAVKCAISTLTDKIISSESDLVGVCFYGTREKNNPNDFENIFVFSELDVPDAQKIIDLETLLKSDFSKEFGHCEGEFPFCDALWTCSTMFSNCTTKVGHKRIFLFTNDDNPNANNENLRNQSIQRAKDLAELGIDIELFPINKATQTFNPTKFYQYVITVEEDEDTGTPNFDAAAKFEELRARVRRKEFKKRSLGRLSLFIADDIEVAVKLYNLVQTTTKGPYVWLDAKTNQPLKTITHYVDEDTGTLLVDSQIRYVYEFGGEKIFFQKEEIQNIKHLDRVEGLRLMGFKPISRLKYYHNLKHASFLYPDEQSIKGSTVAFSSLLAQMLKMQKMAICMYSKSNSTPRFVALLPQKEEFDHDGTQMTPPGFHLIHLPYADDIRPLKFEPQPKATTEQIVKAKKVVKSLRIKFDSRNFENPALQRHYANLQAIALDREILEETPDYVVPDEEGMAKYADLIDDFRRSVFPETYNVLDPKKTPLKVKGNTSKGQKRRLSESQEEEENEATLKRHHKESVPAEERDWEYLAQSGQLENLNVSELTEYATWKGLKGISKMKKSELVQLVKDHITKSRMEHLSESV
jgi:ATP-dependent DNA helicase 2 subunit 1